MLRLKIFFVLAGMLITVVMIRTVLLGVQLPERAIVKWSQIHDAMDSSSRIADFIYPMLQAKEEVCFSREPLTSRAFVEGLKTRLAKRNLPLVNFPTESASPEKCFAIHIREVDSKVFKDLCPKGDSIACIGLRALKKLESKDRRPNQDWVSLYRIDTQKAVLFYFTNKTKL